MSQDSQHEAILNGDEQKRMELDDSHDEANPASKDSPLVVAIKSGMAEMVNNGRNEDELIADMAEGAAISTERMTAILEGETSCPDRTIINGIANVLAITPRRLMQAANESGCEYRLFDDQHDSSPISSNDRGNWFWSSLKDIIFSQYLRKRGGDDHFFRMLGEAYLKAYEGLEVMPTFNDLYTDEETGQQFAVFIRDNQIFRRDVSVIGGRVELGEEVQLFISELERAARVGLTEMPLQGEPKDPERGAIVTSSSSLQIRKGAGGRDTYVLVSATPFANGANAIDGTELIRSFMEHKKETGHQAVLNFVHLGQHLRIGQDEGAMIVGKSLVQWGMFDDSFLARVVARALRNNPKNWGTSIEFRSLPPDQIELDNGVRLEHYRIGIHDETAILLNKHAAHRMTAVGVGEKRVAIETYQLEAFEQLAVDADLNEEERQRLLDQLQAIEDETEKPGRIWRSTEGCNCDGCTCEKENTMSDATQELEVTVEIEETVVTEVAADVQNEAEAEAPTEAVEEQAETPAEETPDGLYVRAMESMNEMIRSSVETAFQPVSASIDALTGRLDVIEAQINAEAEAETGNEELQNEVNEIRTTQTSIERFFMALESGEPIVFGRPSEQRSSAAVEETLTLSQIAARD